MGWHSFIWMSCFFFCLMKTTPWWSKVSFWCHGHQTTEEEENLFIVFLLLLVPNTLFFNLTSLSMHALANTNYTLMCLGGHTMLESHVVASMEGNTITCKLNKFQRILNYAARIITNEFDFINVWGLELVKKLGWMSTTQRFNYFCLLLMFRCVHG